MSEPAETAAGGCSSPASLEVRMNAILGKLRSTRIRQDEVLDLLGQAFSIVTFVARDHIDLTLPAFEEVQDSNRHEFQKQAATALRPLVLAHGFYGQLFDELLRGIWCLEMGFVPPALNPSKRQGGHYDAQTRELTIRLVSLAQYLKASSACFEEYRACLAEVGIHETSIGNYRKSVGFFSTEVLEDPYRAEDLQLMSDGKAPLSVQQKVARAKQEMRAIKPALGKYLKNN